MSATPLRIQETPVTKNDIKVLQLTGPLVIMHVKQFQETTRLVDTPRLILDFTAVPYVDSAGVGSLVGLHISAQKNGRRLGFVGLNDKVRAILQMTNVAQLFPQFSSVSEAEEKLL